jgi:hypothetical protein
MWPELSYNDSKETFATMQLWTQIIGKIKLSKLPWINHSWHVTLMVDPTGLTSGNIPDKKQDFQLDLDLIDHQLLIKTSKGLTKKFSLINLSVAEFYKKIISSLGELNINVKINPIPSEIENAIPFDKDTEHTVYDADAANNLHTALLRISDVFTKFRSKYIGKNSPVHFFWGGFDLAVSRFSGRTAPKHPGGIPNLPDRVAEEAYSHEVSSCGFWTGNELVPYPAFYSYIYPEPAGFDAVNVKPEDAFYHKELREFILPYELVIKSDNPENTLLEFMQSTYESAANLAKWDRKSLEKA